MGEIDSGKYSIISDTVGLVCLSDAKLCTIFIQSPVTLISFPMVLLLPRGPNFVPVGSLIPPPIPGTGRNLTLLYFVEEGGTVGVVVVMVIVVVAVVVVGLVSTLTVVFLV